MIYKISVNYVLNQVEVVFAEYAGNGVVLATTTSVYTSGEVERLTSEVGSEYAQLLSLLDKEQTQVPSCVTMRQARHALLDAGLLPLVEQSLTDGKDLIDWEYAAEVYRNSGLVSRLSEALGLSELEVDKLFIEASKV